MTISSKLVNNHYSNKVTWDDKEIAKYNKGQAVEKLVLIGTGVVIDIFTTKKPVATVLEVYLALNGRNEDYTTKNIQWLPRKGWSWKIYYEKTESGYATYLVVYNDKGKYDTKYKLKTYTYSTITPAIH